MAGAYSLKTFLRNAPPKQLKKHLKKCKVTPDVPWAQLSRADLYKIAEAIQRADGLTRAILENDFRAIFKMGDAKGAESLLQEGLNRHHNVDLALPFSRLESDLARSYWTYFKHPELFRAASDMRRADECASWHKLSCLPSDKDPNTMEEVCKHLEKELSNYFSKNGHGRNCEVDDYAKEGKLYWFCHPEERPKSPLAYNNKNELKPQLIRKAFDVVFQYSQEERFLEVYTRGGPKRIQNLQQIFCSVVLGFDLLDYNLSRQAYKLDCLLDRNYPLPLPPDSLTESVQLSSLKLLHENKQTNHSRKIIFEADGKEDFTGVHDLIDALVAGKKVNRESLRVLRADFLLIFRQREKDTKPLHLPFHITAPDMCSLRNDPDDEIAKELLKQWGIDVSRSAKNDSSKIGRILQHRICPPS